MLVDTFTFGGYFKPLTNAGLLTKNLEFVNCPEPLNNTETNKKFRRNARACSYINMFEEKYMLNSFF